MASAQSPSAPQSPPAAVDQPAQPAQNESHGSSSSPPPTRPQFSPPTLELSLADLDDLKSSLGLPLTPTSPIMPGMRASSASPPPLSAPGGDPSWGDIEHRPYATLPARSTSAPPTPVQASATDDLAPHLFWVPAHQHPEIAPLAFKDWLSRHDMQLTDSAVQRVRRRKSYRDSVSVLSLKRNQSTGQSQVVISPVHDTDDEHEVHSIPEEPSEDGQQPPKPIHRTTLKRNLRTRPLRRPNSPALGAPGHDEEGSGGPSPPRNRNRDSTGSLHRRRSHPRTSFDGVVPDMDAGPKSPTSPTSPTSPIAVTAESLGLPLPPVIPPVLGLVTPSLERYSSEMEERHENDLAFEDSVLANYVVPPERSSSLRSRARVRPSVDTGKRDGRTTGPTSPMSPTSPTSPTSPPAPVPIPAPASSSSPAPASAPTVVTAPGPAEDSKPSPVKSPPIIPPTLPPLSFDGGLVTPTLKSPPPTGPSSSSSAPELQPQQQTPPPALHAHTLHTTTVLAPLQIPPRVASVTSASTLLADEKPHAAATVSHTQPNQQPLTLPSLLAGTPAKDPADGIQPVHTPVPAPEALPPKPDLAPVKPADFTAPSSEPVHAPAPPTAAVADDSAVGRPRAGSNASLSSIDGIEAASTMSGSSAITDKSPPLAKKKKGLFNFGKKKKDDAAALDHAVSAATAGSASTTNGMVGGDAAGDMAAPKMKKSSSWGWLFSSSSSSSSHKKVTPADAMTAVAALDAEDTAAASGTPAGKKKEKSLVASLFKSGSSSSTAKKAANGAAGSNATATGRAAGGLVGTPGGAGAHKYSNYAQRYPIHIERAICRLAHAKLANPRRPLHHQVLISNMLVWYMSLRKAEEEAAAQAALNGAAAAASAAGNASASGGESSGDESAKAIVWKGGRFQSNLGGKGKRRRKGGSPRRTGQGARSAEMVVASPSYSSGSAGGAGAGASPRWPEQDGYTSDGRGGVGAPGGRKKGGRAGGRRRKRRGRAEGNSSSESDSSDEEDEDEDDVDDVDEDESVIEAPATPKLNGVSGPPLPASGTSTAPVPAAAAATADDEDDDVPLGLVMQKKPDAVKS